MTQKETERKYFFSEIHQTTNVKFYDYNPYNYSKILLVEAPIDRIVELNYSLNYTEYLKEEIKEEENKDIDYRTLGEICNFLPKSKRSAKYGNDKGKFPFFRSSNKIDSYVDEADYNTESLIIGDGGEPNVNYSLNFSASDHCYVLQNKDSSSFKLKYVYYYLYHNLNIMKTLYTGIAIKNISKSKIKDITIPIPPIETQEKVIEHLEYNNSLIKKLEEEAQVIKNESNQFIKKILLSNEQTQLSSSQESQLSNQENKLLLNQESQLSNQESLIKKTIKELKEICKAKKLSNYNKLKKSELIYLINNQ